uniref:Uncharacterized protein n=1 Tax=Candidatus Kentrum sp. TUN TaxID=2126343 RepID=A0A450ZQ59_9GAMM|nr:MAG: hypothetical protein BECKTUN1418F_GA0071002_10559 [Candidatus Kentron sp. TUN]VFK55848.1 MAG: hypothetical protein BECKTUN1418D_GA0071000_10386 [Candidatus Kentron sp. TUN]VFK59194.1 MAG: hypothetical protein BECKTUN1418E_GA0071001_10529 [Candidatus Kentron sp. TUN]
MKTLILEVDDAIYPRIKGFLDSLPDTRCHLLDQEEPDDAETETIQSIRAAYRAGREEAFDDWEEIRDRL